MSKRRPVTTPRQPLGKHTGLRLGTVGVATNLFANSDENSSLESTSSDSNDKLSIVAQCDDYVREVRYLGSDRNQILHSHRQLVQKIEKYVQQNKELILENRQLLHLLEEKNVLLSDLEDKHNQAQHLFDVEKRRAITLQDRLECYENQLRRTREVLLETHRGELTGFEFLNAEPDVHVNGKEHCNTTESLLSDMSFSRSVDDLDVSKKWKKHRPSGDFAEEPANKKRRPTVKIANTEKVRATTTVTVPRCGPITATSVIESVPMIAQKENATPSRNNIINNNHRMREKQHQLQDTKLLKPEKCQVCGKRMFFNTSTLKCVDCRAICHDQCKDKLRLPCVPCALTPHSKNKMGALSDHTPQMPPMIPALIVHCVNEIESRGLDVIGLYRVPGAELDVKVLKDKLLQARGTPNLRDHDVHTLCSVLKMFLRGLQEPVIPHRACNDLVSAIATGARDPRDTMPTVCQVVLDLPQSNRDTLAYLILHLKRVAASEDCKMPIANLAKIFAVTLMSPPADDKALMECAKNYIAVTTYLLNMPDEFYTGILQESEMKKNRKQNGTDKGSTRDPFSMILSPPVHYERRNVYFPSPQ